MIDLYDDQGRATAFCDGRTIYLWEGRAVAYLLDDKVFAFSGRFIGWLTDGWIIDDEGRCLLFESDAIRGPGKPSRRDGPHKSSPQTPPPRCLRQAVPARPAGSAEWSDSTFAELT
ncbi:4-fold beta flower protein [Methylobacterium oxalidis]|uniref:4-fold beta flower protein n=1 Tax=Methylobacterium oxalidis TaxID=944322 RepID=UPI0038B24239